jgi:hypothetical protein
MTWRAAAGLCQSSLLSALDAVCRASTQETCRLAQRRRCVRDRHDVRRLYGERMTWQPSAALPEDIARVVLHRGVQNWLRVRYPAVRVAATRDGIMLRRARSVPHVAGRHAPICWLSANIGTCAQQALGGRDRPTAPTLSCWTSQPTAEYPSLPRPRGCTEARDPTTAIDPRAR